MQAGYPRSGDNPREKDIVLPCNWWIVDGVVIPCCVLVYARGGTARVNPNRPPRFYLVAPRGLGVLKRVRGVVECRNCCEALQVGII